jgi:hypothetical protein
VGNHGYRHLAILGGFHLAAGCTHENKFAFGREWNENGAEWLPVSMFEGFEHTAIGETQPQIVNGYREIAPGSGGSSGGNDGIFRWQVEAATAAGSATLDVWAYAKDGKCRMAVEGTLDGDARRS